MAIDYIKIKVEQPNIKKILAVKELDFSGSYSASTGVINEDKIIAKIHFCEVVIYKSGTVYFSGSMHKMYNSIKKIKAPNYKVPLKNEIDNYKGYNGNQYGVRELDFTIKYLEKLLHQTRNNFIIRCIELGLNLEISFSPKTFIVGLLYTKSKIFDFRYNRNYAQMDFNDYRIKIYNKSSQYGMLNHTIRVEVNFSRMALLDKAEIKSLDITPKQINRGLEVVLSKFNDIVYYDDTINVDELTKPQKKNLSNYKSCRYWIDELKPNKRHEPKQKLNNIIVNHSQNLKKIIITQFAKTRVINTRCSKSKTRVINTHSYIGVNITQNSQRKCPVTGVDISMQKEDSFLLSNTGLKHLEIMDIEKYNLLTKTFITGNDNKFEKDIYSKLSKQIRNRYYNNSMIHVQNQFKLFDKAI